MRRALSVLALFAYDYVALALVAFLAAVVWIGLDRLLGILR
jgi:hypothetical protein